MAGRCRGRLTVTRETHARHKCHNCSGEVAVKLNVGGKAYYNCDHCGFQGKHTWQRSSDAYVAKIAPKPAPAPANVPPAAPVPTVSKPVRQGAGTVLG